MSLTGYKELTWHYRFGHRRNVLLFRPNYWNQTPVNRSGTMIHIWMHLYYVAGDVAYDWSPDYNELNTLQQLVNADSFSEFVKQVCGN